MIYIYYAITDPVTNTFYYDMRHYPRYYVVTNPATMSSLTPLL